MQVLSLWDCRAWPAALAAPLSVVAGRTQGPGSHNLQLPTQPPTALRGPEAPSFLRGPQGTVTVQCGRGRKCLLKVELILKVGNKKRNKENSNQTKCEKPPQPQPIVTMTVTQYHQLFRVRLGNNRVVIKPKKAGFVQNPSCL